MSETISKASVCEILADIYPTDGEKVVAVKEIDEAYEAIQQLPSVHPKLPENWWKTDHGYMWLCPHCGLPVHSDFEECLRCGTKRQSAQPEQKKGKWEQVEIDYLEEMDEKAKPSAIASMFCPVCHRYHNEVYFHGDPTEHVNYCSYCGAKMMRGEQE